MSNTCSVGNNYFSNQGEKQGLLTIVKFYYEGMIHFSKNVSLHFGSHPVTHLMDNRPEEQKDECKFIDRNSPQKTTFSPSLTLFSADNCTKNKNCCCKPLRKL